MENEGDDREFPDNDEGTSESESEEGSDAVAAEVEPEVAAARHNYNLRPKRKVPDPTREPELTAKDSIAPGARIYYSCLTAGDSIVKPIPNRT